MARRKGKILFIDTAFKIAGGQKCLIQILKNLDKKRYHPMVMVPGESDLIPPLNDLKIKTETMTLERRCPKKKKKQVRFISQILFEPLLNINRLIRLGKKEKIDLIYANTTEAGLYGGIVSQFLPVPVILHNHINSYRPIVNRILDCWMSTIVFVSKSSTWDFVKSKAKRDKYHLIYNALDPKDYFIKADIPTIRNRYSIKERDLLIGTVSRISPEKKLEYFIQAMPEIKQRIPNSKFLIVGGTYFRSDVDYLNELREMVVKFDLNDAVIFTGFLENIMEIIPILDIVISTSPREAFSVTLLEAMAAGKPVIATDIPANQEAIVNQKTGILIPAQDASALLDAVIYLLTNPDVGYKMGQAGKERVETMFSVDKQIQQLEQIYHDLLNNA